MMVKEPRQPVRPKRRNELTWEWFLNFSRATFGG